MAGRGKGSYGWYNSELQNNIHLFFNSAEEAEPYLIFTYLFSRHHIKGMWKFTFQLFSVSYFKILSLSQSVSFLATFSMYQDTTETDYTTFESKNQSFIVYYTQHIAKITRLLQWSIASSSCRCIGKSELLLHFVAGWPSILLSWCLLIDLLCWGGRAEKDLDVNIFTLESFWSW